MLHPARALSARLLVLFAAVSLVTLLAAGASFAGTPIVVADEPAPAAQPAPGSPTPAPVLPTPTPLKLTGKFDIAPQQGPAGTRVTASGTGMPPDTELSLAWTTVKGSWKLSEDGSEYHGREYTPVEMPLATATTDAGGSFQVSFEAPDGFGFQHDVLVRHGSDIINKAGFDVNMEVAVSPASGPPGTPITIEAHGIGWRELESSWLVSYDNAFTGWLSAVTTDGHARAVIPATGAPGTHVITILHGEFTFPYLNMQQNPEPDRPQFHIPFTITEGETVLPPALSAQELPAPNAAPAAAGALQIDPPAGIVGSTVTVRGANLPPDSDVPLTWSTVKGNRISGVGFSEETRQIGTARTDPSGNLAWQFTIPDDLGGSHTITAKAGGAALDGTFTIQPSAQPLIQDRGPSGTPIMIQLNGVGWTETANIYHMVYDNAYAGYACGFNSGGNVQIFMVVSGAPGWHFIDLYPGIYKGQETRPNNFRIPQLTYAADHPGEQLPAFHFAFYITPE